MAAVVEVEECRRTGHALVVADVFEADDGVAIVVAAMAKPVTVPVVVLGGPASWPPVEASHAEPLTLIGLILPSLDDGM